MAWWQWWRSRSTVPPMTTPASTFDMHLSVWYDEALDTLPLATLLLDQFPDRPVTGVPENNRYTFTVPSETHLGWGANLALTGTEQTAPYADRCLTAMDIADVRLASAHVDPSGIPLETLAKIRGAMWTVRGPWAYGPRPYDPSNMTALEFIGCYPADVQAQMLETYLSFGYTHCCIGPVNAQGYHGQYPDIDYSSPEQFEVFLDILQMFWDHGLTPIVFLHPDNWTLAQTQALYDPLIRTNDRAQRLMRCVVPSGWEPTQYGWSSETWADYMAWGRDLLPNALVLLHTVADVDAPVGTDANGDDNGKPNAEGWARVVPYIHGWLTQSSAFAEPDAHGDPNHPDRTNFQNWQDLFNPHVSGSYQDRFQHGYAGWPTNSAWGPTTPIKVYAAEYCSYWEWNDVSRTYAEGVNWGDAAMAAGADGYLDSGSVPIL